ncbi:hypothetical protein [uncultured Flavobacterium sp.]|nr:hypothetical protein [uncultured Flavobacterium sp.]
MWSFPWEQPDELTAKEAEAMQKEVEAAKEMWAKYDALKNKKS